MGNQIKSNQIKSLFLNCSNKLLAFFLLVAVLATGCSDQLTQSEHSSSSKQLNSSEQTTFIPYNSDLLNGQGKNSEPPSEFGCTLSTLNNKGAPQRYRYQSFYIKFSEAIIQEAAGKVASRSFLVQNVRAKDPGGTLLNKDGIVRYLICRIPDAPAAKDILEEEMQNFGPQSWSYNAGHPDSTKASKMSTKLVCELVKHKSFIGVADVYGDGTDYYTQECSFVTTYTDDDNSSDGSGGDNDGFGGSGGNINPDDPNNDPNPCSSGGGAAQKAAGDDDPIGCVEEIEPDDENNFLVKIDVIDLLDHPKAKCIFQKIAQTSTLQNTISKFAGENSGFNLNISVGDAGDSFGSLKSELGDNTFDMIISGSDMGRVPLEIANTFLHESLHAEMRRYLYGATDTSTLSGFPGDFSSDWDNYVFEKYGDQYNPVGKAEHQAMAKKYVDVIADGLEEFDSHQLNRSYYESLAYVGINDTESYNNLDPDKRGDIGKTYQNLKDKLNNRSNKCH